MAFTALQLVIRSKYRQIYNINIDNIKLVVSIGVAQCFDTISLLSCLAIINAVIDKPQQFIAVGGNVEFSCSSDPVVADNVTWTKSNGNPFPPNIVQSGTKLIISSANIEDGGTYLCTTSKQQTSVTSEATLIVVCKYECVPLLAIVLI